jgi:hypothetical protein
MFDSPFNTAQTVLQELLKDLLGELDDRSSKLSDVTISHSQSQSFIPSLIL